MSASDWVRSAAVSLIAVSAVCLAAGAQKTPDGWQLHVDPKYGFAIAYPPAMTFFPDPNKAQLSYIPICSPDTVACFEYTRNDFKNTQFEGAGLAISVIPKIADESACLQIDQDHTADKPAYVNGTVFHSAEVGSAGLGHSMGSTVYRTYRNNTCFEISLSITQTDIREPEVPSTMTPFDEAGLDRLLNQMLQTFHFNQ